MIKLLIFKWKLKMLKINKKNMDKKNQIQKLKIVL